MIPCMPMLVQQIQITPSQFGVVVSAFGLAKLIINIPSGQLVDIIGRKPLMVWGMKCVGISIASAGFTLFPGFGVPWLVLCRIATGSSLSVVTAGFQMYITDISNHLNRARMFVPLQSSFHLGMIFGPVLGGLLINTIGISNTFFTVGFLCVGIGILNQKLLIETLNIKKFILNKNNTTELLSILTNSFNTAFIKWKFLFENLPLKRLIGLNTVYWFVLSGTQMTLLPIILYKPPFEYNAIQIGGLFAYMSCITILTSPYVAKLADKYDKVNTMLGCSSLIGLGIIGLSQATSTLGLLSAITPITVGATGLSTIPTAYSSDIVHTTDRAQAQSLIRTCGDIGFVGGATTGGLIADVISIPSTLYFNSSLMLTYAISWFILKQFVNK